MSANITVARRIYGGFALVLVLLASLALIAVLQISRIHDSQNIYASVSGNSINVSVIEGDISELRRLVTLNSGLNNEAAGKKNPGPSGAPG